MKKKRRNKHHLKNRVKGGKSTLQNLLLMDEERHQNWHKLFGNLDLRCVIKLLIRVAEAKEGQTDEKEKWSKTNSTL